MVIQMQVAETMHEMHSGSVPTYMLAVFKLAKALISANMYGMRSTCVVHRSLKWKIHLRRKKRSFGIKVCMSTLYVAEIMHRMHCGSVPTSMLALFKLVKTLISANMHGIRCTSNFIDFWNGKLVGSTQNQSFCMKSMYQHLYTSQITHGMHSGIVPTSMLAVLSL